MIPNYILMVSLGLKDTVASFILPGVISTYYVILMRSFFESVPKELEEAGEIDGLSRFGAFIHVDLDVFIHVTRHAGSQAHHCHHDTVLRRPVLERLV